MSIRLAWIALALLLLHASAVNAQPNVQIFGCGGANAAHQQWEVHPAQYDHLVLKASGQCLDVEGYGTTDGSNVWVYDCHPNDKNPSHQNQAWIVNADGTITEKMSGKCLDRSDYGTSSGTNVQLWSCTGAHNQKWAVNTTDGTIRAPDSGLCLDAGSMMPRPCDAAPGKSLPFCNTSLSYEARTKDLVGRLTTAEKMGLFANGAKSVPRLSINAYQWWSEALHGVAGSPGVKFQGKAPCATSFPQVVTTGSSFNTTLWHMIGQTISTEARAMNNLGQAGLTFWAPNINVIRDPRWGRGQETPGEDPYATAQYAAMFVSGMQDGPDTKHLKVSSCCKHFDAYDLENWHGVDRHHFNAIVTQQDLTDTYLPAFQSCVEHGKGSGIMCSYNAVNGVPSCANKMLMTDYARDKWGFQGYITSDCGAVSDVINAHHYTNTSGATCRDVLEAGMDIDCGGYLDSFLSASVQSGAVPMSAVDTALTDLFMVQMRLGMFDPLSSTPYSKIPYTVINSAAHQQLALEAARQGLVLLKNDNNALPLDQSSVKTIAVVGPNGNATKTMQGNYYGQACFLISPVMGLQKFVPATSYVQGCDIASNDTSGFAAAEKAAGSADVTLIFVGLDQSQESEGHDRDIISLPGVQNDFITSVSKAAKGKVIVVVMSGGPLDLSTPKSLSSVDAMLWVGYPGQSGGQAIAEVLFGAYNPGGRLPYTMYPADFVNQVSMFDMNMRPNKTSGNPGHTYRFYTGTPVYEYGYGLSYTSFTYNATVADAHVARGIVDKYCEVAEAQFIPTSFDVLTDVQVVVKNVGKLGGADVVILFLVPPKPGVDGAPLRFNAGFDRIYLDAGQSKTLHFKISAHHLSLATAQGGRATAPGTWTLQVNGQTVASLQVA